MQSTEIEEIGEYKGGGIVTEVKPELVLKFRSLQESLVHCVDLRVLPTIAPM